MSSIRRKLLLTLIAALLVAGFVAATGTFFFAQSEFNTFLDQHLKNTAQLIKHLCQEQPDQTQLIEYLRTEPAHDQPMVIQIYDFQARRFIFSTENVPLPLPAGVGFSTDKLNGMGWRIYTETQGPYVIEVAHTLDDRTSMAASAAFRVLQPLFLLLPFIGFAVWFVLGDGLAPLERTARSVARRSPTTLEPISTNGLPLELEGLVHNINHLMQRLQESLQAQQRFASDAAHELRTPLTAIKLQVQLAQRAKTPEKQALHFQKANDGINRATRLVEQLLTLTRLDPESTKRPSGTVKLDALIESVAEDMRLIAEQKHITISTQAEPATVEGMEDALRLLFTNLTDNAIRYTPEGGKIELSVKKVGDNYIACSVKDNGPGIAPDERSRIFDRFYRALGTEQKGTGLGLAIVKRIVDIHHGKIEVDEGLNHRGTSFTVTLSKFGPQLQAPS